MGAGRHGGRERLAGRSLAYSRRPLLHRDQPKPGTNGFAIASFVLGLLGGVLLSVIFGIVALSKIRHQPQRGKGLAIAGLCLSGVWVVGIVAVLVVNAQTASQRSAATGQITKNGHLGVLSLQAGDCFQNPSGSLARRDGDAGNGGFVREHRTTPR